MDEQDYDEYMKFLNSIEDDDEDRRQLERLGLEDPGRVDVSGYDPE